MVQEEDTKNTSAIEMVPTSAGTKLGINIRIQKGLEVKQINPCAYDMYLKRKFGNT